uniref:Putative integrase/recombinase protein n=1 Tax=Plagiogramma staurophorum TaxID=1003089 RepID=A0A2U9NMM4_9STRA|nr:putative integrase/recombinase protein [Plagiogramma staurophorum]AWT38348.1 putative integrase/recombinase protein [Plagiogramma staurophorum]
MGKKNQIQKINKENNQLILEVESKLDLLVKGQENNSNKLEVILNDLRKGFIGLALRNEELLQSNDQLKEQLDDVLKELNTIKKEREEKAARQKKWAKRKRLPKRDPINLEIYNLLMKESEGPTYIATRTRIAICLLTVTGIRIGELLSLKVGQLETLIKEGWISIDRLKRGPANHKAFLTSEGKKIVKARKRDFEFLFLMKDKDSHIFTSDRKPNQKLRRETITMDVNKVTHSVSNFLPSKPNITSHSFRIGYISQLWKDTKDIEFVRQTIGHRSLNATSSYVSEMGEKERQDRFSRINT